MNKKRIGMGCLAVGGILLASIMSIDLCMYLFITPIHLLLASIGIGVGLVLRRSHPEISKKVIKGSWLLMGSLLITGFLLTECWGWLVFGQYYDHFDYWPGIDCSPFWLNPQYGTTYLRGMTEHGLVVLWRLYALLCWGSAAGMTWWFLKRNRIRRQRTTPPTVQ
jgi:hypothetical protein